MAKGKIFHLTRESDHSEHLVRAIKDSAAIAAIAGSNLTATVATQDDIYAHFGAGGALHDRSVPEDTKGARIIRVVATEGSGEPSILIRAKNPAAAIEALTGSDITAKVADQETLVRLLKAHKEVLDATGAEGKKAPAPESDASGGPAGDTNAAAAAAANDGTDHGAPTPGAAAA